MFVFSVATFFSLLFNTYVFLITFDTALTGLKVSSILEQFHASVSFLSPPNVFRYIRGGAGGAGRGVDQLNYGDETWKVDFFKLKRWT